MLDQPLAHFIRVYHHAFFERVGLRYLNAISRQDWAWRQCRGGSCFPAYVGLLAGARR